MLRVCTTDRYLKKLSRRNDVTTRGYERARCGIDQLTLYTRWHRESERDAGLSVSACRSIFSHSLPLITSTENYVPLLYELTRTNGECAERDSSSWSWCIKLSRVSRGMCIADRYVSCRVLWKIMAANLDQSESSIPSEDLAWFYYPRLEKMADSLTKYGIYIDDLSKIRVLEPEAANQTNKLKDECQNFVSSKLRWLAVSTNDIDEVALALLTLTWLSLAGRANLFTVTCVCVRYLFDECLHEKDTFIHSGSNYCHL